MPGPALIEIENAHHMDVASAELLSYLVGELAEAAVDLRRDAPAVRRRIQPSAAPAVVKHRARSRSR